MTAGRDITLRIITDTAGVDTSPAVRELDDLGAEARRAGDRLDDLATDAATTARHVTESVSDIDRAASTHLDTGIGTSVHRMGDRLGSAVEEAKSSAGEIAGALASATDLSSAATNLGQTALEFGPVGAAIGAALIVGVNMFEQRAEEIKQRAADLTAEMIANNGKITSAYIDSKITAAAAEDPNAFLTQKQHIEALGLAWTDYIRAKYGDVEATQRITGAIKESMTSITDTATVAFGRRSLSADAITQLERLKGAADDLGVASAAVTAATDAYGAAAAATVQPLDAQATAIEDARLKHQAAAAQMSKPITPTLDGSGLLAQADDIYGQLAARMAQGITIPLGVSVTSISGIASLVTSAVAQAASRARP